MQPYSRSFASMMPPPPSIKDFYKPTHHMKYSRLFQEHEEPTKPVVRVKKASPLFQEPERTFMGRILDFGDDNDEEEEEQKIGRMIAEFDEAHKDENHTPLSPEQQAHLQEILKTKDGKAQKIYGRLTEKQKAQLYRKGVADNKIIPLVEVKPVETKPVETKPVETKTPAKKEQKQEGEQTPILSREERELFTSPPKEDENTPEMDLLVELRKHPGIDIPDEVRGKYATLYKHKVWMGNRNANIKSGAYVSYVVKGGQRQHGMVDSIAGVTRIARGLGFNPSQLNPIGKRDNKRHGAHVNLSNDKGDLYVHLMDMSSLEGNQKSLFHYFHDKYGAYEE